MDKIMAIVVPALLCAVLGCVEGKTPSEKLQSGMRAKPAELSEFLPNHELLKRQPDTFPFHYFYLKKDCKYYERVYVAPVDISVLRKSEGWAKFDEAMAGQLGTKIEDLASYMKKAYEQAFRTASANSSSRLQVLDKPSKQKGTLVIETAIVAFCPTKAELNAAGMAVNVFVFPGLGLVASAFSSGSLTVECRIRDAATGEIVSMNATTESDPKALIGAAQFTWTTSAQLNIKQIAAYTAEVYLSSSNYGKVQRKSPIGWTALIKDAKLEDDTKK